MSGINNFFLDINILLVSQSVGQTLGRLVEASSLILLIKEQAFITLWVNTVSPERMIAFISPLFDLQMFEVVAKSYKNIFTSSELTLQTGLSLCLGVETLMNDTVNKESV